MSCLTCNIPVYNLEGDGRLRNADGQLHICDSAGTETDAVDPVVEQAAEELGRIAGEAVSKARVQILEQAGQTEAPDTPYSQLAELASVLLKSIARAEARIQILEEKQKERDEWEQRVQNTPVPTVPVTVSLVAPPTGLSAKNAINYKDSICDNCNQIHDGTGRVIDVRGKLVKNPNPCSNPQ